MAGTGLINGGTPPYKQRSALKQHVDLASLSGISDTDNSNVMVRTVLDISRDTLDYWQNMTYFFNKWWFPEPGRITLPFCFFHVVRYSEIMKAETSQKRVIVYEPPVTDDGKAIDQRDILREGAMQTIVDNVVLQPKEYKMEVVLPFMPYGRYVRQGLEVMKLTSETLNYFGRSGGISTEAISFINTQLSKAYGVSGLATKAQEMRSVYTSTIEPNTDSLSGNNGMINKNSLDAMFERGSILQFKTWMGFDYKYVVVTNVTSEKRSTEDDVWRLSVDLKEMPVLSLSPVKGRINKINRSWQLPIISKLGGMVGRDNITSSLNLYKEEASSAAEGS